MESIKNVIMNISHTDMGYISAVCLGLCSLPLVVKTVREGHCKGVSGWFLTMWFIGEAFGVTYVVQLGDFPLMLNYIFNTIVVLIILIYKIRNG